MIRISFIIEDCGIESGVTVDVQSEGDPGRNKKEDTAADIILNAVLPLIGEKIAGNN